MTNAEIVKGIYNAFSIGDIPAVLAFWATDIEWTEAEGFPYGGVYVGPNAVLENVFMKLGTEWEGFSAVPGQFVAEGDVVVSLGTYSGKYIATGKSMRVPFAHVWTLLDGKAVKFAQYTDTLIVSQAL